MSLYDRIKRKILGDAPPEGMQFYALLDKGFCYTGPYADYRAAAAWITSQKQPEKWSIVAKKPKGLPS